MNIPSLLKDPLIHFLIIGLLLFVISDQFFQAAPDTSADSKVVVSKSRQEHLALVFENQTLRKPDQQEMQDLVNNYVLQEVYYREALKLGLDQDDELIKRRLQQKLELLHEDAVVYLQPDDEVLEAWYRENQSRFITLPRFSFTQILLSKDTEIDIPQLLIQLNSKTITAAELNTSSMLELNNVSQTEQDISSRFGESFAAAVTLLSPNDGWQGPIDSVFGRHLVIPLGTKSGETPELEAIRSRVADAYQLEKQRENKTRLRQLLLEKYEVDVE